jgi:hypothetical protein
MFRYSGILICHILLRSSLDIQGLGRYFLIFLDRLLLGGAVRPAVEGGYYGTWAAKWIDFDNNLGLQAKVPPAGLVRAILGELPPLT